MTTVGPVAELEGVWVQSGAHAVLGEQLRRHDTRPVLCLYPEAVAAQARAALQYLPQPYYAVKANTSHTVLTRMASAGLTRFDVASLSEIRAVHAVAPDGECAYMNPVKAAEDIAQAYRWGVRIFALDSPDELAKILSVTQGAEGCCLLVRLGLQANCSVYDMSGKFGASPTVAAALLQRIATLGIATGLTFHVGSQCEDPAIYASAIAQAAQVAAVATSAGVVLRVLDVGGGFAANYRGQEPSFHLFGKAIADAFATHREHFGAACSVQCEPGRSLVAAAGSVLVRVELRRDQTLFLNDGVHGLLSELRWMPGFHPVRNLTRGRTEARQVFSLAGPACNSDDLMQGPYALAAGTQAGDWLEIGYLGAYCGELVTPFNGFGGHATAHIAGAARWHAGNKGKQ